MVEDCAYTLGRRLKVLLATRPAFNSLFWGEAPPPTIKHANCVREQARGLQVQWHVALRRSVAIALFAKHWPTRQPERTQGCVAAGCPLRCGAHSQWLWRWPRTCCTSSEASFLVLPAGSEHINLSGTVATAAKQRRRSGIQCSPFSRVAVWPLSQCSEPPRPPSADEPYPHPAGHLAYATQARRFMHVCVQA